MDVRLVRALAESGWWPKVLHPQQLAILSRLVSAASQRRSTPWAFADSHSSAHATTVYEIEGHSSWVDWGSLVRQAVVVGSQRNDSRGVSVNSKLRASSPQNSLNISSHAPGPSTTATSSMKKRPSPNYVGLLADHSRSCWKENDDPVRGSTLLDPKAGKKGRKNPGFLFI